MGEVIRSCSLESLEFCKAMQEKGAGADTLALMKTAIQAHNSYAKMAVAGLGVDRHMQGLKLIAQEAGKELPSIFSDPGFLKSGRMRISSSQVAGASASFLCFGPLADDGYGVCYNPRPTDVLFPRHLGPGVQGRLGDQSSRHAVLGSAVRDSCQ